MKDNEVYLTVKDTGNHTANLVLFMNALMDYAFNQANLSPDGFRRFIEVFREDSKKG